MPVPPYSNFGAAGDIVRNLIYQRQNMIIHGSTYRHFDLALHKLGYSSYTPPSFEKVNNCLQVLTGWKTNPLTEQLSDCELFRRLAINEFSGSTKLSLVLGYIPLLADPVIAAYLHRLALIALRLADHETEMEQLIRLYRYTIDFGLVREKRQIKIYGAHILSSIHETEYCLSPAANRIPFDLGKVLQTPYDGTNGYQQKYFVLDDMRQLHDAVNELERLFRNKLS